MISDQVSLREIGFSETFSETFINQYPLDNNIPYKKLLFLISLCTTWTLVLSIIPAFNALPPDDYYAHHPNWYTGNDVIRLIEPIGGLILNFLVLYESGIFEESTGPKKSFGCIIIFLLGAGIYTQGAGFHSASTMFGNCLDTINDDSSDYNALYYYIRTVWQSNVSHYLYGVGYLVMNAAQAFAYKDHKSPYLGLTFTTKCMLLMSSIIYAILIAAVASVYPSGIIVAVIYLVLYGGGVIGGYTIHLWRSGKDKKVFSFGYRPILQYFFLSYILALIFIIIYVASVGGIKAKLVHRTD